MPLSLVETDTIKKNNTMQFYRSWLPQIKIIFCCYYYYYYILIVSYYILLILEVSLLCAVITVWQYDNKPIKIPWNSVVISETMIDPLLMTTVCVFLSWCVTASLCLFFSLHVCAWAHVFPCVHVWACPAAGCLQDGYYQYEYTEVGCAN